MKLSADDRAEVVRLYTTPLADGTWMGTVAIARRFGITPGGVRYQLQRAGITPRSSREAFSGGKRTKPIKNLPTGSAPLCKCGCASAVEWNQRKNRWNVYVAGHYREDHDYKDPGWLREHYIERRMTAGEIAVLFGVGASSVLKALETAGISRRSRSESRIGRHLGTENGSWKGGVTPERQRLYRSPEWKALIGECLKRDGYHCIRCGSPKTRRAGLHVHHIKSWAEHPEMRMEPDNLITLCNVCHVWVHSRENTAGDFIG